MFDSPVQQLLIPILLVAAANSAPWAAARIFAGQWTAPLDFGTTMPDGTRLLGSHKTWRGLVAAIAACAVVAQILGLGVALGALFGSLAILGDASSSFVKRRLRSPPGTEVPGLDQVPESLLPLLAMHRPLGLSILAIIVVAAAFAVLDIAMAKLRQC